MPAHRIALAALLVVAATSSARAEPAGAPRTTAARAAQAGVAIAEPRDRAAITGELAITGPRSRRPEPYLAASEITAQVSSHAAEVERCYLGEAGELHRTSRLDLTLSIGRDGRLLSAQAAAPGLASKAAHNVSACAFASLADLRFPERRYDTTAVVPYSFQKTAAPNAGPQLSCWNPKGC